MTTNNHQRQANSWFARDHHENYNLMRAQQMYDYPRKYDTKQATILEENLDYYSKKRPCRFCGGTGSDPSVSRKINNCRVHDATKVNYNSKEKFGTAPFGLQFIILKVLLLKLIFSLLESLILFWCATIVFIITVLFIKVYC